LDLANALSANGMSDEATKLYDDILCTKKLKRSALFFLALFNKSLLLLKMGRVEEAQEILHFIEKNRTSTNNDDVRKRVYHLLGNLSISDGRINDALVYFENSLDMAGDDMSSLVQAKKDIGLAHSLSGQYDLAIATFEDALEDLSAQSAENKSANLLKVDIWNCLSRVYKKHGNFSQAKHFSRLGKCFYDCRVFWGTQHLTILFHNTWQRCKYLSLY
jgi:tetratricopeptide (TPR) repeat protein